MSDPVPFHKSLLRWFGRAKRPLPWRETRDPYAIWVSEVMLQQTTVTAVIPYYERFLKRFPTVASLAASDEDSVLALWSGLGYYSRARNLRLAAQRLMHAHEGRFPSEVSVALTLEGVGAYTARAVTSIAYGTRAAVVDGNVTRVLSRLHALRGITPTRAQALADRLLPAGSPGRWNEAMMELGATICTPREPRCGACPLFAGCRGHNRPHYWSQAKPRRLGVTTPVEMALVVRRGSILLVRNPKGELMGGLYELPHAGLPRRTETPVGLRDRYRAILVVDTEPFVSVRHTVTHHRIIAHIFRARVIGKTGGVEASFHSLSEALDLPVGGLTRKALRAAGLGSRSGSALKRPG